MINNKQIKCKFGEKCENLIIGKKCNFFHSEEHIKNAISKREEHNKKTNCKFGEKCENLIIGKKCNFFHSEEHIKNAISKREEHKKKIDCKFGEKCENLIIGKKCIFNHSEEHIKNAISKREEHNKKTNCKFGEKCLKFLKKECEFIHTEENKRNLFGNVVYDLVTNKINFIKTKNIDINKKEKIVGMLIDLSVFDDDEILEIINDEKEFDYRFNEALELLEIKI